MKKINTCVLVATSLVSTQSFADVSVYGLINKEVRVIQQKSAADKYNFTGVTDVDGFESRLGAKAKFDPFTANLELGVNSALDNLDPTSNTYDRIRIRMANIKYSCPLDGVLTLGSDWVPGTIEMVKMDPLSTTGFQAFGLDVAKQVKGFHGKGLGYKFSGFNDMLSYQTKTVFGANYTFSYIRPNSSLDKPANGLAGVTSTHTFRYDINVDATKVHAFFDLGMPQVENSAYWTLGAKVSFANIGLIGAYGQEKANATDSHSRIFTGADYTFEKWRFALTYSLSTIATTKAKDSQVASAAYYAFNENVNVHAGAGLVMVDNNGVAISGMGAETSNSAFVGISGVTFKF